MKLAKKWNRRIFAAVLGAVVAGAPLLAVQAADPTFSQNGERYDVRRGMYEKEGGSDEHVRLGKYADEKHQEARHEERREDLEKRQAEERKEFEKSEHPEEAKNEAKHEEPNKGSEAHQDGPREYKYDVRRGMYEKEGCSDTQVRRGMYEQPDANGEPHHSLTR